MPDGLDQLIKDLEQGHEPGEIERLIDTLWHVDQDQLAAIPLFAGLLDGNHDAEACTGDKVHLCHVEYDIEAVRVIDLLEDCFQLRCGLAVDPPCGRDQVAALELPSGDLLANLLPLC